MVTETRPGPDASREQRREIAGRNAVDAWHRQHRPMARLWRWLTGQKPRSWEDILGEAEWRCGLHGYCHQSLPARNPGPR